MLLPKKDEWALSMHKTSEAVSQCVFRDLYIREKVSTSARRSCSEDTLESGLRDFTAILARDLIHHQLG